MRGGSTRSLLESLPLLAMFQNTSRARGNSRWLRFLRFDDVYLYDEFVGCWDRRGGSFLLDAISLQTLPIPQT